MCFPNDVSVFHNIKKSRARHYLFLYKTVIDKWQVKTTVTNKPYITPYRELTTTPKAWTFTVHTLCDEHDERTNVAMASYGIASIAQCTK